MSKKERELGLEAIRAKTDRAAAKRLAAMELLAEAKKLEGQAKESERKSRNGRAILVGLLVLDRLEAGKVIPALSTMDDLLKELDPFLVRPFDRARFGLPTKNQAD
jgi:hypothetical protein